MEQSVQRTPVLRRLLLGSAALVLLLVALPAHAARADAPVSDLSIRRISGARRAKACQTFSETYQVENLGPDPAHNVVVTTGMMDQFDPVSVDGTPGSTSQPFDLAPGDVRTVVAYFKVTAFVPGEARLGRISASVHSEVYPDIALDPVPENNDTGFSLRLIGRQQLTCTR